MEIIRDVFNERDANKILQIPLSFEERDDSWMWLEDEKGVYSVKSGYKSLCNRFIPLTEVVPGMKWLKLWSLAVPPKIKNFMWRTLRNCVPTLCNLREKWVNVDLTYHVCRMAVESLEHLLFTCPFAQRCWE